MIKRNLIIILGFFVLNEIKDEELKDELDQNIFYVLWKQPI